VVLRRQYPATGVLVLSQYVRVSYAAELLDAGADGVGYLLKDRVSDLAEFTAAIRRVGSGGSAFDPDVVSRLLVRRRDESDDRLTERERAVLALMAEGRTNQAIAQRLFIAERTVEKHCTSIFTKLELTASPHDHRRVLAVLRYLNA
jgi:DNA-binding NarL/FixJ family response regulator